MSNLEAVIRNWYGLVTKFQSLEYVNSGIYSTFLYTNNSSSSKDEIHVKQ